MNEEKRKFILFVLHYPVNSFVIFWDLIIIDSIEIYL